MHLAGQVRQAEAVEVIPGGDPAPLQRQSACRNGDFVSLVFPLAAVRRNGGEQWPDRHAGLQRNRSADRTGI